MMRKHSGQKDDQGDDQKNQKYDHGYPEDRLMRLSHKEKVGNGNPQTV
jgi:hypothetical protein